MTQNFSFSAGLTIGTAEKTSSYCKLDDPGVNRRLSSDVPSGADDNQIKVYRAMSRLPRRLREMI